MLRGESFGGGAFDLASRLGKLGQPRGTNTGAGTNGRSAARHVSPLPQGRGRVTRRKGWRSRPPSLRGLKSLGFSCPHVEVQLQKSLGDVWPRISSAYALQKERQGRVNGGLARSEGRRVKPSASASSEGNGSRVGLTDETGEDRRRPRVTRDRHLAVVTSPKAVRRSWGRGRKGHRIL